MITNINKNISVWRGNNTPPTGYHLWIKENGSQWVQNQDGEWIEIYTSKTEVSALKIEKVEPSNDTILTSYELHDVDGNKRGVTIDIPKDQTIRDVKISTLDATLDEDGMIVDGTGTTALCISYILADGSYKLVPIDYQKFLEETEFGDGTEVVNHKVQIKVDPTSDSYLTVGPSGLKLSGIQDDLEELSLEAIKQIKLEDAVDNLSKQSNTVTIPKATKAKDGILTSVDKTFIDGIRDGNLALPTPVITGTWSFYNNADEPVERTSISPVPNADNPQLEQGYKASFSGSYKWTHEESKKDPTQVQSGSSWSDLPATGVNSQTYTSAHLTTNTTIKIGIQAAKTGLMVSGSNVVPASGMDTTTAQRTVSFTTRRYFGVTTSENVDETTVKALSGELGGKSVTKSGVTATTSQYYMFAYPKSLGALTTIIQDGATPVLGAFTRSELTITNAAGLSVQLYVYRSNNKGAFTNAQLQFS